MERTVASIDIGTHTARLLIARKSSATGRLTTLTTKRAYTHIAENFDFSGTKTITPEALKQTLHIINDFSDLIEKFNVDTVYAAATGIVREAKNRKQLIDLVFRQTGISVKTLSGEEEADKTARGVLNALEFDGNPVILFDLGGGSTEFFFRIPQSEVHAVRSLSLGAKVQTSMFFSSDPPKREEMDALSEYADKVLKRLDDIELNIQSPFPVIGTGGTVTALAAIQYGIPPNELKTETINGLTLDRRQITHLLEGMRKIDVREKMAAWDMEKEKAEVILTGTLIVFKIIDYFRSTQLIVSQSDLLEGMLI